MKLPTLLRSALVALLSGLALGGASAQPSTAQPAASAASAPAATKEDPQRIIVTANRRREEAQKVSGVVQSLNGDDLRKDGITEFRSLQTAVPGLSIANQEGNVEIYIRGVGSANNTELGDPAAAPHINGIYIPRPRGLGLMFFDLERVEVNKGPQGTLYGRNALAGTLNVITAKPRLGQAGGYVQGELASRNGVGAEAALNIPLGENMAARAAFSLVQKDAGFNNYSATALAEGKITAPTEYTRSAAALKPAGLEDNYALRLSYLWELSDRLRFTAMIDGGKESGTGYPGANINEAAKANGGTRAEDLDMRNVVYRGPQGEMTNYLRGGQAKFDYDLGGGITAEISGSVRDVDFYQRNASSDGIDYKGRNYDATQFDSFSTVFWQQKSRSYTGELRLFNDDAKSRFNWSAGLFGFKEDQKSAFFSLSDRGYCCYSGTEFTMPKVEGKSAALFADGSFKITESFRALGGLRYTKETKAREGIGGNIALGLGGVTPGNSFDCCFSTRLGTEGYVPALLGRPNFDLSPFYDANGRLININSSSLDPALRARLRTLAAQFLAQGVRVPGARDTLVPQIAPILTDGTSNGACIDRPDIDNGRPIECAPGGTHSFANLTIPERQIGSSKANYTDFRAGLEFDLNKDTMVYGKVSTGHKAGGFNDSFSGVNNGIPETFKPEKVVVLESGLRTAVDLGGRRALFNLTGFYYDYKDQVLQDLTCISFDVTQASPCQGYSLVNRNIGGSRIAGLEFETKLPLVAGFRLDLNATYLDTKITKGTLADFRAQDFDQPPAVNGEVFGNGRTPFISVVGNELPLASKINVVARLQQAFSLGAGQFDWQVLVNYRSSYYLTPFNEMPVDFLRPGKATQTAQEAGFPDKQKGFTTVNLGIGYTLSGLRLEAFAMNVTNEQASQKAIVGNNLNIRFLNDARTYGMRVRASF
jgi:iron complex outermembrane recepter protein